MKILKLTSSYYFEVTFFSWLKTNKQIKGTEFINAGTCTINSQIGFSLENCHLSAPPPPPTKTTRDKIDQCTLTQLK